jgi:hypothetical protein
MCLADRYKTIYICASGSVGGARPCQGRGRGFESRLALFKSYNTISYMREWLSWWSTTLPRSGPRVRVPSRALLLKTGNFDLQGFLFFCCSVKAGYSLLLLITVLRSKPFVQRQSFFFLHYDKIGTVH